MLWSVGRESDVLSDIMPVGMGGRNHAKVAVNSSRVYLLGFQRLSANELAVTETELAAIASPASAG
jgi:hypothetical protein